MREESDGRERGDEGTERLGEGGDRDIVNGDSGGIDKRGKKKRSGY